jgi:hypothetical protein
MDPEDQVARMEEASRAGLTPVGWYHSHPTFPTQPSAIDVYNQVLQQHAHRDPDAAPHAEPYVAAIVGPYDRRTAGAKASLTWFYVEHAPGKLPADGQPPAEVGCVAKNLAVSWPLPRCRPGR